METTANHASGMAKTVAARAAIWRKVIGRDGSWQLLECGHEAKTEAAHVNGRKERVCPVCTRLERDYSRWLRKGLVTKTEARRALRGIRTTRRPSGRRDRPR